MTGSMRSQGGSNTTVTVGKQNGVLYMNMQMQELTARSKSGEGPQTWSSGTRQVDPDDEYKCNGTHTINSISQRNDSVHLTD